MRHWLASPWALTLLAVLPLLAVLGTRARRRRRQALARLGGVPALGVLIAPRDVLGSLRVICLVAGLALLVAGIAGPQWGRDRSRGAAGRDLIVVLDVSRSMLAEMPSRLHRAKAALVELSKTVQEGGGHRLGLVVFATRAKVACPLTHDYDHFRQAVRELDENDLPPDLGPEKETDSGTRFGAGLRAAVEAHDERFRGSQDILMISDGDDPVHDDEWRSGVAKARDAGIPVHTVGVGDPDTGSPIPTKDGPLQYKDKVYHSRLEEKRLQEIADLTGGTYTGAHLMDLPLDELFRTRIKPRPVREDSSDIDTVPIYRQQYTWFLGGALALLAGEMLFGRGWPKRDEG